MKERKGDLWKGTGATIVRIVNCDLGGARVVFYIAAKLELARVQAAARTI
jgi:hypothetical protein